MSILDIIPTSNTNKMAPQQNSTLIDDNLDGCPSLLNLPEELKRYSPILPPKNQANLINQDKNNDNKHDSYNTNNNDNNNNDDAHNKYSDNNNDIYKLQFEHCEKQPPQQQQQQYQQEQELYKCKHYRSGSNRGGHGRRCRSVSLYGVNSTVEQGHKEIPIWIASEPRYVSGVTKKTTCNDIIKALIDDEVRNGNYATSSQSRGTKDGGGTASRDYSDYVITESWRGIERSYNGNMRILPVWKAWSHVHNELRLSLKHHQELQETQNSKNRKTSFSSLKKCICKLFRWTKNKDKAIKYSLDEKKTHCLVPAKETIPDEILFVILPDKLYEKEEFDIVNNLKSSSDEEAQTLKTKFLRDKLYKLSETRASLRKRQRAATKRKDQKKLEKRRSSLDNNNCINRRREMPMRSSLRNRLAQKTTEIDGLFEREYQLTKKLSSKCKLYRLQNEVYRTTEKQLDISVGKIQHNVEEYAKEIIETEHELLELKNEIKHDISIINDLKRLTLEENGNECGVPQAAQLRSTGVAQTKKKETLEDMHFVDNIYEFCDNNASMLV